MPEQPATAAVVEALPKRRSPVDLGAIGGLLPLLRTASPVLAPDDDAAAVRAAGFGPSVTVRLLGRKSVRIPPVS